MWLWEKTRRTKSAKRKLRSVSFQMRNLNQRTEHQKVQKKFVTSGKQKKNLGGRLKVRKNCLVIKKKKNQNIDLN
jgi:hypothetical protein